METGQSQILSLEAIEKPFVGVLSASSDAALRTYMDGLRPLVGGDKSANDFKCGAFEISFDKHGLALTKLADPPYVDRLLIGNDDRRRLLDLAKAHFATHGEPLEAPIREYMQASGQAALYQAAEHDLINQEWRLVVLVDPLFRRTEMRVGLHRDTKRGDLYSFALLYCNDSEQMGPEYILRPPLAPDEITLMKQNMPPAFFAAIQRRLQHPMEPTLYAPVIEPHGYITACDGLIYHSTPFVHHRGAYGLDSLVIVARQLSLEYFGDVSTTAAWRQKHLGRPLSDKPAVQQSIARLDQLGDDGRSYVDAQELKLLLPEDDFREYLIEHMGPGIDPFEKPEPISRFSAPVQVPRGKDLKREMSDKLDANQAVQPPDSIDFLRLLTVAVRRK